VSLLNGNMVDIPVSFVKWKHGGHPCVFVKWKSDPKKNGNQLNMHKTRTL